MRAKITTQGQLFSAGCLAQHEIMNDGIIGFDIRSPKRINRLFGIAHNEELARRQPNLRPRTRLVCRVFGQVQNQFVLNRVRILKLINQNRVELLFDFSSYPWRITKQVPCLG